MDAGLDLDTLTAGLLATDAAAGEGAPAAGYAPPPAGYVPAPPEVSEHEPVAAFDLYWDEEEQVYRMRDPVVSTPDGEELECKFPEQLDFGKKYYCVVGVGKDGDYKAKVVPEGKVDGSGYDSWWKVPLFTVPHKKQGDNDNDAKAGRQYHVGAVVVGGEGVTPDNVSTEFQSGGGKLQVKGWATKSPLSTAVAADLAPPEDTETQGTETQGTETQGTGDHVVVRKSNGSLAYKPMGCIVGGTDSNIKITPAGDNLVIDVYYV